MWTRIPLEVELPDSFPTDQLVPEGGFQAYLVAAVLRGRLTQLDAVELWARDKHDPKQYLPVHLRVVESTQVVPVVTTWVSMAMTMSDPKAFLAPLLRWVDPEGVKIALQRMTKGEGVLRHRQVRFLKEATHRAASSLSIREAEQWYRLNVSGDGEAPPRAIELENRSGAWAEAWLRLSMSIHGRMNPEFIKEDLRDQELSRLLHNVLPDSLHPLLHEALPQFNTVPSRDMDYPGRAQATLAYEVVTKRITVAEAAHRWETDWFGPMGHYVPQTLVQGLMPDTFARAWMSIAACLPKPAAFMEPIDKWVSAKALGVAMSTVFDVGLQKEMNPTDEKFLVTMVEDALDVSPPLRETVKIPNSFHTYAENLWKVRKKKGQIPEPRGERGDRGASFARAWIRLSVALGLGTNIPSLRNWANADRATGAAVEFFGHMATMAMATSFTDPKEVDLTGQPKDDEHLRAVQEYNHKIGKEAMDTQEGRQKLSSSLVDHIYSEANIKRALGVAREVVKDEPMSQEIPPAAFNACVIVYCVKKGSWTQGEAVDCWIRDHSMSTRRPTYMVATRTPKDKDFFNVELALVWMDLAAALARKLVRDGGAVDGEAFKKIIHPFIMAMDYWFDPSVLEAAVKLDAETSKVTLEKLAEVSSASKKASDVTMKRYEDLKSLMAARKPNGVPLAHKGETESIAGIILDIHHNRVLFNSGLSLLLGGKYRMQNTLPEGVEPRDASVWTPGVVETWLRVTEALHIASAKDSVIKATRKSMEKWIDPGVLATAWTKQFDRKKKPEARSEQAAALVSMVHSGLMSLNEAVKEWNSPDSVHNWKVGSDPMSEKAFPPELVATWMKVYDALYDQASLSPNRTPAYTGEFISAVKDWVSDDVIKKGWAIHTNKTAGDPVKENKADPAPALDLGKSIRLTATELRVHQSRAMWEAHKPDKDVMTAALNGMIRVYNGEWTRKKLMDTWDMADLPKESKVRVEWTSPSSNIDRVQMARLWIKMDQDMGYWVSMGEMRSRTEFLASMHNWILESNISKAVTQTQEVNTRMAQEEVRRQEEIRVQENLAPCLVTAVVHGTATLMEAKEWWNDRANLSKRALDVLREPNLEVWNLETVPVAASLLSQMVEDGAFDKQVKEWGNKRHFAVTPTFQQILEFITRDNDMFAAFAHALPKSGVMEKIALTALAITQKVFLRQGTEEAAVEEWNSLLMDGTYRTAPDIHVTPEFLDTGMRIAQKILDTQGARSVFAFANGLEKGANNPKLWSELKERVYAADRLQDQQNPRLEMPKEAEAPRKDSKRRVATVEQATMLQGLAVLVGYTIANTPSDQSLIPKELTVDVLGKKWVDYIRNGKDMGIVPSPTSHRDIIQHGKELLTGNWSSSVKFQFSGLEWSAFLDCTINSPTKWDKDGLKFSAALRDVWRQYAALTPEVAFPPEKEYLSSWVPDSWEGGSDPDFSWDEVRAHMEARGSETRQVKPEPTKQIEDSKVDTIVPTREEAWDPTPSIRDMEVAITCACGMALGGDERKMTLEEAVERLMDRKGGRMFYAGTGTTPLTLTSPKDSRYFNADVVVAWMELVRLSGMRFQPVIHLAPWVSDHELRLGMDRYYRKYKAQNGRMPWEEEGAPKAEITVKQRMLDTLKSDAKEIALRTGVKRVRAAAAARLGTWWASQSNPRMAGESEDDHALRLKQVGDHTRTFLNTDMGEAALTMLLGFVWTTVESEVNPIQVREFGSLVARELRISGGTDILDGIVTEVLNPVVGELKAMAPEAVGAMTGVRVGENPQALEEAQEGPQGAVSEPVGQQRA